MLKLPEFKPNRHQLNWVKNERRTAKVIRLLWQNASMKDRANSEFLRVLIQCSWTNQVGDERGSDESDLRWRNSRLSTWLGLGPGVSNKQIADGLTRRLGLSRASANWLVRTPSGFTHYFTPFRPLFLRQVGRCTRKISNAFTLVSSRSSKVEEKVGKVTELVLDLPGFTTPNEGHTSMMNGLAAALVCLDPQRRFPVMNAQTDRLLRTIHQKVDVAGAQALSRLIGKLGIQDSFFLDVYSAFLDRKQVKLGRLPRTPSPRKPGRLAIKSEQGHIAEYARKHVKITKKHNWLTNKFLMAVEWKSSVDPKQGEYDILLNWHRGRSLLIEAKTSTKGYLGRFQLRQAIGQLFDYRWRNFKGKLNKVDLALLTPTKPIGEIRKLLKQLKIESLWFEGKRLRGTVDVA
jgi:hypothetical protein